MKPTHPILTGGALVMAVAATVFAQDLPFSQAGTGQPPSPPKPAPAPAAPAPVAPPAPAPTAPPAPAPQPETIDSFFTQSLPEAFTKGKFNINVRTRYEYVTQANLPEDSNALTVRTRFGFTTAPLYGFQGMIEGENITAIGGENHYNAAGSNNQPIRPVVADPVTTELNQAWLGYSTSFDSTKLSAKLGRQQINLDNQRFVGDVNWRQNMQTMDAATASAEVVKGLELYYGYVWDVHRVYGNVDGLPAANRDFDSNSHLINVSYNGCPYGRLVGYTYLLDLKNAAGPNNSCATYGAYFAGYTPASDKIMLGYRAEFAWQTDYAESTLSYGTEYYNLELSAAMDAFALGAGYEVLGSDNGVSFRTPLATLHAFNGWADQFLTTPPNGLRDLYAFAQYILPANIPLRAVYHTYEADRLGADYGQEWDFVASKKFGKNWTVLLKYAYFNGQTAPTAPDVQKVWAQVEFNF
jgi:hypothetical protein